MSALLFAPEALNLAEVTRMVAIARRIEEHECIFSVFTDKYAAPIREAGFECVSLTPSLSDTEAQQMLDFDQGKSLRHPFTVPMLTERVQSERRLIRKIDARAVVIGTTMSQFISAQAEHVPLIYARPDAFSPPYVAAMHNTGLVASTRRTARFLDRAAGDALRFVLPKIRWVPKSFRVVARANNVTLPNRTINLTEADLNLLTTDAGWMGQEWSCLPTTSQSGRSSPNSTARYPTRCADCDTIPTRSPMWQWAARVGEKKSFRSSTAWPTPATKCSPPYSR